MTAKADIPDDLTPLLQHLEATYPDEGCGIVLRNSLGELKVQPMRNVCSGARTAYLFDLKEWLAVLREADASREQVTCIYHSHPDAGAYFSAADHASAAPEGRPLYPNVSYLVVAVEAGQATAARLYRWRDGSFEEADIPLG